MDQTLQRWRGGCDTHEVYRVLDSIVPEESVTTYPTSCHPSLLRTKERLALPLIGPFHPCHGPSKGRMVTYGSCGWGEARRISTWLNPSDPRGSHAGCTAGSRESVRGEAKLDPWPRSGQCGGSRRAMIGPDPKRTIVRGLQSGDSSLADATPVGEDRPPSLTLNGMAWPRLEIWADSLVAHTR